MKNKINGKYKIEIQKIEDNDEFYVMRIYDNSDDKIVMSTVDYLKEIYNEATKWLVK